jgi:hypothetical protein
MTWLDVDGARAYLSQGRTKYNTTTKRDEPIVSRKSVYAMVDAGLRVAPRGESGKRYWFCVEWIDEFLVKRSSAEPAVAFIRERMSA